MSTGLSAALLAVATALLLLGLLIADDLTLVSLSIAASAAAGGVLVAVYRRNRDPGERLALSEG